MSRPVRSILNTVSPDLCRNGLSERRQPVRPIPKIVCLLQLLRDTATEEHFDFVMQFSPGVPWHHCVERRGKAACDRCPSTRHLEETIVASGYHNLSLLIAFNDGNAGGNFIDKLLDLVRP